VDKGLTGGWVSEDQDAPESDLDFGQIILSPKTAAATTYLTRAWVNHAAPGAERYIRNDISKALRAVIEEGFWTGPGGRWKPVGLLNTTGMGAVIGGSVGAAPGWSHLVDLEGEITEASAGGSRMAYITNSAVRRKLKQTAKDVSAVAGGWCWEKHPNSPDPRVGLINGYPAYVSNYCPSNLVKGGSGPVCSAIILGDWEDLMVGIWGAIELLVNPYTSAAKGGVRLTAYMDVDMALRHPESFAVMRDALTS
jgi:HK97 family phage major capsid protein